jgi:hypothetical protein
MHGEYNVKDSNLLLNLIQITNFCARPFNIKYGRAVAAGPETQS